MCGICGWVAPAGGPAPQPAMLKQMADTLFHRGPDGEGAFLHGAVAFAHRRLNIIDMESGQQPMRLENGLTIVFNGEIYNYLELRSLLQAKGHRFKTKSDTEVLLAAYDQWGEDCLEQLNGMFSFVIYDPGKMTLFFARDRMGEKPFYYFCGGGSFAFASELKALLVLPAVQSSLRPDPKAVSDFLSLGYILTPKTIFENIHRLPAAHCGTYEIHKGTLAIRKYWRLEDFYHRDAKITYDDKAVAGVGELLFDACRLRMRSDVSFGGFLSGGLDSSSIVSAMSRMSKEKIQAFTAGFSTESYDETRYADMVARGLGVEHVIFNAEQPEQDILSQLVWHFDEPFADTSLIPTYWLNHHTKKYATVALSGDGADEIFGGYPTYMADRLYRIYRKVPASAHALLFGMAKRFLKPSYRKVSFDYRVLQFMRGYGLGPERAHYWWRVIFSEEEKRKIMGPDVLRVCEGYDPYEAFAQCHADVKGCSFLDQTLYTDQKTWLQDDILVKADRMSMANSVEVRSPFLDHRLVEMAARLPEKAKIAGARQKVVLKEAMKPYLPAKIINRGKRGFGFPTRSVGKASIDPLAPSPLISSGCRLDGTQQDITYKSFCFAVLEKWINMYGRFTKGGGWRPDAT